ncbi:NAD(P)H-dependent oxidoreductase [Priestia aryabhattai]|uniref:NAD(P)H-dependent oxidoreductase n=1 Tax=Priestia aryabhattai TaxID=412384 RepID=UPI000886A311|nr:Putative NADPH-quinone reductase (modulator of drug activity B) [Priestia aryabhattai B8W22]
MKTLVILAHPNLASSRINKAWAERLKKEENVYVHDLYANYPDFKIDVEKEQELVVQFDRIVFQFPFYWYSSPALLKEWQDVVLTYGWAYGSKGTKLHGKEFIVATSTGGPAEAYQEGGYNRYPMNNLLLPFQATANLTGMKFQTPFLFQGAGGELSEKVIQDSAESYAQLLRK